MRGIGSILRSVLAISLALVLSACDSDKGHWDDAGENWKRSKSQSNSVFIQ